ncbi:MAG TPA: hypothetical protein G4O02_16995 [Caldilineae bacterium]|nr:hypothetical protein [Caldilineae bacterium]
MEARQASLFPAIVSPMVAEKPRPPSSGVKLHRKLLAIYGPGPEGEICANCQHFYRKRYANTYFKCALAGDSNSYRTDWRARWPACGHFDKRR